MPSFSIAATRTFTAVANGQYVFVTPGNGFIGFATYVPAIGPSVVRELVRNQLNTFGSLKVGDAVTVTVFDGSANIETDGLAPSINQNLMVPTPWGLVNNASFALASYGVTTSGHKCALIFAAPKAGVLEEVGLMVGAVTGGATVDVRIETVDASGDPSGTLVAAGANANLVIAGGDANSWKAVTIGTPPTVSAGALVAIVIDNTPSAGNFNVRNCNTLCQQQRGYGDLYTGTWAKQVAAPNVGVRYKGDVEWAKIPGVVPATSVGTSSYNSASNPDERGVRIVMPFGARIVGLWAYNLNVNTDSDCEARLYFGDSLTPAEALSVDGIIRSNVNQSGRTVYMFATPRYALQGETVRATFLATNASNNIALNSIDVASAAVHGALDMGTNCVYTNRNDGGAWSDVLTTRMFMGIIVDQVSTAQ